MGGGESERAEPGSSFVVLRITKPEQLISPPLVKLILRALEKIGAPISPSALFYELSKRISDPAIALFVGAHDGLLKALCFVQLPTSALMIYPQIVLAYNEGPQGLAKMVAERVRDLLLGAKFDRCVAMNLRHDDKVFIRGLAYLGKPSRLASVVQFEL